jgi:hypothetical protein
MTRADDDDAGIPRIEEWRTISAGDDIDGQRCGGTTRLRGRGAAP